jgi:hypothetical protein
MRPCVQAATAQRSARPSMIQGREWLWVNVVVNFGVLLLLLLLLLVLFEF